jgi:magnesium transporter
MFEIASFFFKMLQLPAEMQSESIIGVGVAIGDLIFKIAGNICISIALNIQKYVHNNLSLHGDSENSVEYIQFKLWWLGLAIMIFGELGNFAAYGFAPVCIF